jgi:hypothetical protein
MVYFTSKHMALEMPLLLRCTGTFYDHQRTQCLVQYITYQFRVCNLIKDIIIIIALQTHDWALRHSRNETHDWALRHSRNGVYYCSTYYNRCNAKLFPHGLYLVTLTHFL